MVTYSPAWQRNLRVVLCIVLPPILGAFILTVLQVLDAWRKPGFSWSGALLLPFIYSGFAFLLVGFQSVVYAVSIELWIRRSNPRQSGRSHLAFLGYSAALGGLAGISTAIRNGPPGTTALSFIFILGAGVGLLTGFIVSHWLVYPPDEDTKKMTAAESLSRRYRDALRELAK